MKKIFTLLFGLSLGFPFVAGNNRYTCPSPGGNPVVINVPEEHEEGAKLKVILKRVGKNKVCNLFRVVAKDGVKMNSLSAASDSADFTLEPVARSYHKKKWQEVAGPYSATTKVKGCTKEECKVRFPVKKTGKFRYVLMTVEHQLANLDEERSRFLSQTTFGPTLSEIKGWSYGEGFSSFLSYFQEQLALPATSHRAYFREHLDYPMIAQFPAHTSKIPMHPCAQYSRWRDYVFTGGDYYRNFKVTQYNGQLLISVQANDDGEYYEPMSVVPEFQVVGTWEAETLDCNDPAYAPYCGAGEYQTCGVREGIDSLVFYKPRSSNLGCLGVLNPAINLPESIFSTTDGQKLQRISLPALSSFEEMPPINAHHQSRFTLYTGHSWRMLADISSDAQCSTFKSNDDRWDFRYLIGQVAGGQQFHYEAYVDVKENTVENPLPDGGAHSFEYYTVSRMTCTNNMLDFTNMHSCRLSTAPACVPREISPGKYDWQPTIKEKVLICGSHGEVKNNPGFLDKHENNMFRTFELGRSQFFSHFGLQKGNAWAKVIMEAKDQLRQRMAWALSQILVVTQNQIADENLENESYLHYYDIFVRNAFGNYRDILKEVSYSPMMAEMLSFLESRSAAYVLRKEGRVSRPDENYAREIMQLFTIGIHMLKSDGKIIMDDNGAPTQTYKNIDIQNFARAWTGFRRHYQRSNFEGRWSSPNRINPMVIDGERRDQFPKTDLMSGFIGDGYPECQDLPKRQYLRIGSKYRLLGSNNYPLMHQEGSHAWQDNPDFKRLDLNTTSALFTKLCNAGNSQDCDFQVEVTLDSNLSCETGGEECMIDNPRVVKVEDIYYEYLRPPCVELVFQKPDQLKKVVDHNKNAMCLHKKIPDVAMPTCCRGGNIDWSNGECTISNERVSYATAEERCPATDGQIGVCDPQGQSIQDPKCQFWGWQGGPYRTYHWTNAPCSIKVRVTDDGQVSLVHEPSLDDVNERLAAANRTLQQVTAWVNATNINFFNVYWKDEEFPKSSNNCAGSSCQVHDGHCFCDVGVTTKSVFKDVPTLKECEVLKLGAPNPLSFDNEYVEFQTKEGDDVRVWINISDQKMTKKSIISFVRNEKTVFVRNSISTVTIEGSDFTFRNPPTMMSLVHAETRDAHFETEAVLDNYFYHPNTPTYIAMRLLERFGFSNASPRFIKKVSKAFEEGLFIKRKKQLAIGTGKRGDLSATIAAILFDPEGKTVALDADPSSGALKEPVMKYISLFRSFELQQNSTLSELRLYGLQTGLGQAVHETPSVFSFFLPEYKAPGNLKDSDLRSPEAMVINAPTVVGFMNGVYSLFDLGLQNCYGGFGGSAVAACVWLTANWYQWKLPEKRLGYFTYEPSSTDSNEIIDELALLLTAGRLSLNSRAVIKQAYDDEYSVSNDAGSSLRLAQKLMISTPEFHSNNVFRGKTEHRPEPEAPVKSEKEYKAIVFVNLHGGMDGFNMLVPHSGCDENFNAFKNYQDARGDIALLQSSLLQISVNGQSCSTFGLHPNLKNLRQMYNDKELAFVANMGVLQDTGVTKSNYRTKHGNTALFSHNTQTEETANVDIFDQQAGIGIGGRILDVLVDQVDNDYQYKTGSISVSGTAPAVVSRKTSTLVVNPNGYEKFNPLGARSSPNEPNLKGHEVKEQLKSLTAKSDVGSSFYGDLWSDTLIQSLNENALLYDVLSSATVSTTFPDSHISRQLKTIAEVMTTKDDRGKDRDFFYANLGGWDMHFDIELPLQASFGTIDDALFAFKEEMKAQSLWDDVVVICISEFARTLMGNTGNGSDHAWGGNYFVMGGDIDGGKILGTYPHNLTNDNELIFAPGIVIPTLPWESIWNGLAQWFGVKEEDLDEVLPNRWRFMNDNVLFQPSDLFKNP